MLNNTLMKINDRYLGSLSPWIWQWLLSHSYIQELRSHSVTSISVEGIRVQSHTITNFDNLHIGVPDSDPLSKNNSIFVFCVILTNYVTSHAW